jgi:hypothetical protein
MAVVKHNLKFLDSVATIRIRSLPASTLRYVSLWGVTGGRPGDRRLGQGSFQGLRPLPEACVRASGGEQTTEYNATPGLAISDVRYLEQQLHL